MDFANGGILGSFHAGWPFTTDHVPRGMGNTNTAEYGGSGGGGGGGGVARPEGVMMAVIGADQKRDLTADLHPCTLREVQVTPTPELKRTNTAADTHRLIESASVETIRAYSKTDACNILKAHLHFC